MNLTPSKIVTPVIYTTPFTWKREGEPRTVVCTFEKQTVDKGIKIELYDLKSEKQTNTWIEDTSQKITALLLLNCPDQQSDQQWIRTPPTQEVVNQCAEIFLNEVIAFFNVNSTVHIPLITLYIDGLKVYFLHLFAKISMWPQTDVVRDQCSIATVAAAEKSKCRIIVEPKASKLNPFQFPMFRICFAGYVNLSIMYGINTRKLDTPKPTKATNTTKIPLAGVRPSEWSRIIAHARRDPIEKMRKKYAPIRLKLKK